MQYLIKNKRTILAAFLILVVIPLTIAVGIVFFNDRSFYMISLTILFFSMLPFVFAFEKRKPEAKELVVIAVICGIAVAGRVAFFMLPQFKPIVAIVIIGGIVFGRETGFLLGAMSAFVSNFFFGQGPWTPWQMFSMGIIGFLAGIFFQKGRLPRTMLPVCIFGGLCTLIVYGAIIDLGATLMWSRHFTWQILLSFYISGFPFNMLHAGATVCFLLIAAGPMIEKLERIQVKYGMLEAGD